MLLTPLTSAYAVEVANCGASSGHAYYLEGAFISKEDSGWTEDGLSDGTISLVRDGTEYDLWYRDVAGSRSVRADGGTIITLSDSPKGIALLVAYSVSIEHYYFRFGPDGGEVVWGQMKHGTMFDKVAVFQAACTGRLE